MHKLFSLLLLSIFSSGTQAVDLIAKTKTRYAIAAIETDGNESVKDCRLDLIVTAHGVTNKYSLKHKLFNCSIFGVASISASSEFSDKRATVVTETVRGGDGDHTGPVLEIFQIELAGIKKIGEQELYDASLIRSNQTIEAISGRVWIGICSDCYSAELQGGEGGVFVPVKIAIGSKGISMCTSLTSEQAEVVVSEFLAKRSEMARNRTFDDTLGEHANAAERRLKELVSTNISCPSALVH